MAEVLCHLVPYLRGEQARHALALATSIRSISPRVPAIAAIGRALPNDERSLVYEQAWQAAQRSTNADVRGEALAALAVCCEAERSNVEWLNQEMSIGAPAVAD